MERFPGVTGPLYFQPAVLFFYYRLRGVGTASTKESLWPHPANDPLARGYFIIHNKISLNRNYSIPQSSQGMLHGTKPSRDTNGLITSIECERPC